MGTPQIVTLSQRIAERRRNNVVQLRPAELDMSLLIWRLREQASRSNGAVVPAGSDDAA